MIRTIVLAAATLLLAASTLGWAHTGSVATFFGGLPLVVQVVLLLIWGRRDPHIPAPGRARIQAALDAHGVRFETRLFDAEHAFVLDEGPRWDPEAADRAMGATVELFRRTLGNRFS